jgi:hypothetical protein
MRREGAMRVNLQQTWIGASLVLIALLLAGMVRTTRFGGHASPTIGSRSSADVQYGAALAAVTPARRPAPGQDVNARQATAMLFMLMAQRGRLGGLGR